MHADSRDIGKLLQRARNALSYKCQTCVTPQDVSSRLVLHDRLDFSYNTYQLYSLFPS